MASVWCESRSSCLLLYLPESRFGCGQPPPLGNKHLVASISLSLVIYYINYRCHRYIKVYINVTIAENDTISPDLR